MSIIRAPRKESNYYILDKQISEDKRLSWAARGLLVYLLGKPDHWSVNVQALINETKAAKKSTGRDGVWNLLKELIEAGYCTRSQSRKEDGTLGEMSYTVSETRSEPRTDFQGTAPRTGLPFTGQPFTANPPLVSNEEKQGLKKEQGLKGKARAQAPATPTFPKLDSFDDLDAEQAAAETQAAEAQAEAAAEAARIAAEQESAAKALAAAQEAEKPQVKAQAPAKTEKPAKAAKSVESAIACPADVPAEVFADFLAVRKAKRAPLTNTALAGIRREADKCSLTLEDALAVCCERGWVGFRADWYADKPAAKPAGRRTPANDDFSTTSYGAGIRSL